MKEAIRSPPFGERVLRYSLEVVIRRNEGRLIFREAVLQQSDTSQEV